ncbi:Sensor protein FixL [Roseimaritima multifibrata]|uniref:histidine kinase n=1 Tax=Roseimaritima multifibrata TaxID=1930274 RepID=A0A517MGH8_9BACT|nr:ATP-binding protein [Roseimaritima multifibrata]QDS93979.1 Sensor protein FixL [Roseimaritima multifibrata]
MQLNAQTIHQIRLARLLIDALPTGMVVTDSQGKIVLINQQAESCFGYREAELRGTSIETLIPEWSESDDLSHKARKMSPSHAQPLPEWKCTELKRQDGSIFPIRFQMASMPTPSDDLILTQVSCLLSDDPEHKKVIQAERLTAIREMASGLAHETNNALQRARACLELLEMDLPQDSPSLNLTGRISEALDDLLRNYEDVKSYASPITLKLSPNINVAQLCQTAFDELTESSSSKHTLVIKSDASCDRINVDVAKIKRVLQAILENGIQASPDGAQIDISCQKITFHEKDAIEISARDHGTGFSEAILPHLFAPFFSTKARGSGLGLAVCRRIVETHQGTLSATNHPDGGALVHIVLPKNLEHR